MWKAPSWWWEQKPVPFGWKILSCVYQSVSRLYSSCLSAPQTAPYPVISIGNTLMGGTGKTPVTMLLGHLLKEMGFHPLIITRGYKGKLKGPTSVDLALHSPLDVGEEAFLLAHHFPTWVSTKRSAAIALLPSISRGIILLDDGHQHTSLVKDISFLVFSQQQKWGNGAVFPAGPLREPMDSSFSRAQGIFYIYEGQAEIPSFPLPVFPLKASFACELDHETPVIGFAGIGYPQRFERTLTSLFSSVKDFVPFPDHIFYRRPHEQHLLDLATAQGARLVTSEKDWVKLSPSFKEKVSVVFQNLTCDCKSVLKNHLHSFLNLKY